MSQTFDGKTWIPRRVKDPQTDHRLPDLGGLNLAAINQPSALDGSTGTDCMVVAGDRWQEMTGSLIENYSTDKIMTVAGNYTELIQGDQMISVGGNRGVQVTENASLAAGVAVFTAAGVSITEVTGASQQHMNQAGFIMIQGTLVNVAGLINTNVTAPLTSVTGLGLLNAGVLSYNTAQWYSIKGGNTNIQGTMVKINS